MSSFFFYTIFHLQICVFTVIKLLVHLVGMYTSKSFLTVFLFCSLLLSKAQQTSFTRYTMHDGLVANPVRCIYQDKKGFIWIGTYEGVSRYDGYKFTNYTNANGLSHNM